jgi:ribosomal protein L29
MGNGKGPEYYVAEIQPGKVLYEIVGVPEELAREAFRLAAAKLPLRTTFVPASASKENMTMKTAELRQKDVAGLEAEVKSLQRPLRPAHAKGHATAGQHSPSGQRRDIARAKTILAEKQAAK